MNTAVKKDTRIPIINVVAKPRIGPVPKLNKDVYKRQGGSTWSAVGWYGALLSAGAGTGASAGFGCLYAIHRSSGALAYICDICDTFA